MADSVSSFSDLSNASSRFEHMAYLRQELGLDTATAALLYRAERLQEKGQLQQSLKYYERVLRGKPDCTEAKENARMVSEELEERKRNGLQPVTEKDTTSPYCITEMQVNWSDSENIRFDYIPDADTAAFREARSQLLRTGHGDSILKLLKNEILEDICTVETGWEQFISGRALFQVTLLPDKDEGESVFQSLEDEYFAKMMSQFANNENSSKSHQPDKPSSTTGSNSDVPGEEPPNQSHIEPISNKNEVRNGKNGEEFSSQFADAETARGKEVAGINSESSSQEHDGRYVILFDANATAGDVSALGSELDMTINDSIPKVDAEGGLHEADARLDRPLQPRKEVQVETVVSEDSPSSQQRESLEAIPERDEAVKNARVTTEQLVHRKSSELETVPEASATTPGKYQTTEIHVRWRDRLGGIASGRCDANGVAFFEATNHLIRIGHRNSFLKLLKNELYETSSGEAAGQALFQVTLIPDLEEEEGRRKQLDTASFCHIL